VCHSPRPLCLLRRFSGLHQERLLGHFHFCAVINSAVSLASAASNSVPPLIALGKPHSFPFIRGAAAATSSSRTATTSSYGHHDRHWPFKKNDVGASSVTTQDFIKFWGKFFRFYLLVLIENSQRFKTF
jgi:hypothetical protein